MNLPQPAQNGASRPWWRPGWRLAVGLALIALGAVPSLFGGGTSRQDRAPVAKGDPRYASQSGEGSRDAHIRAAGGNTIDAAIETCEALGVAGLARRFDMDPEPARLARRFAHDYEPAFRDRAYQACLRGLSGEA